MTELAGKTRSTRERLLEAAGEVFAQRGFREATVREIVGRAGANLNAVNYHFGDKRGLYEAVIEYAHHWEEEVDDVRPEAADDLAAEERLRAFVLSVVRRSFGGGHQAWRPRLMANEMAEPTGALDKVVERFFRPRFNLLVSIVRDLVGEDVPLENVQLYAQSIIGQCIHFNKGRPIIMRLIPHMTYSPADLEALADHITRFSLDAIGGLACDGCGKSTTPEE